MDLLLTGGFLLLVAVIYMVLWLISKRLRVTQVVCPRCGHSVRGLVEPRCPECGDGLGRGVVRPGGIRPKPRRWFGTCTLVVGGFSSILAMILLASSWDSLLRMTGILYMQVQFNRSVDVTIDQVNQLQVNTSGSYVKKGNVPNVTSPGEIEVILSRNDQEVATWSGQGLIETNPRNGVLVTGEQAVEALRSQIPQDSDSPFAGILHHEEDAAILAKTIASYAAPGGSVSPYVLDSRGDRIFDGGISSSAGGGSGLVWPSRIWFMPIYVIPILICGLFLLLGLRILLYRRSLQPFEPQASMV